MRNNELNKTVNEVGTAYTYYIEPKLPKIFGMMSNDNISIDDMKRNIRNYIWNAAYKTSTGQLTKKKEFLDDIYNAETKKDIYYRCLAAVKKARETIAR